MVYSEQYFFVCFVFKCSLSLSLSLSLSVSLTVTLCARAHGDEQADAANLDGGENVLLFVTAVRQDNHREIWRRDCTVAHDSS